jgi:hypothetical protein
MTAICFPSYDGLSNSLVMKDQMEVSPLARGMMSASASTPIRFITKRPLLFPSSSTRTPIGSPYGLLSSIDFHQSGEVWAYLVPYAYLNGLGLAFPPVALHLRQMILQHLLLATCLLAQASQHLWLVCTYDVYQRFTYVDHTIRP